ncbi:MAG TPA: AraC family ligand binding domain-containing protein [Actinospica sp.]|jgi:quercetin dioxygenase-like cupin family protein|nr:AraC family ligand binding domain-containing protein [Actinospica sp.]
MKVVRYARDEHEVTGHGSRALHATRIAELAEHATVTCLALGPGGLIGTHPAGAHQVLLIVAGSGWVAGPDGERVPVTAGDAAYWAPGEVHATGADREGLTAIAVEGGPATVYEPGAAWPGRPERSGQAGQAAQQ